MTSINQNVIPEFLNFADKLANDTQKIALKYFRTKMSIDIKNDESPVTRADREIETIMRTIIEKKYPHHGIIGEEFGSTNPESEFIWALDPIDGTQSFITGKPLFGTLIALLHQNQPIIGIINMPALNERWIGAKNNPTLFQGKPAMTRPCNQIYDAWLYATSPHMFTSDNFQNFSVLQESVYRAVYGAECQAYGFLASGWIDLVCEDTMKIYDYAALIPVIEGAGGVITDWNGLPLSKESNGTVLACGSEILHQKSLSLLNRKTRY